MGVCHSICIKEEINEWKYAFISNIELLQLENRKKHKSITQINHYHRFLLHVPLLDNAIVPTHLHKLEA